MASEDDQTEKYFRLQQTKHIVDRPKRDGQPNHFYILSTMCDCVCRARASIFSPFIRKCWKRTVKEKRQKSLHFSMNYERCNFVVSLERTFCDDKLPILESQCGLKKWKKKTWQNAKHTSGQKDVLNRYTYTLTLADKKREEEKTEPAIEAAEMKIFSIELLSYRQSIYLSHFVSRTFFLLSVVRLLRFTSFLVLFWRSRCHFCIVSIYFSRNELWRFMKTTEAWILSLRRI